MRRSRCEMETLYYTEEGRLVNRVVGVHNMQCRYRCYTFIFIRRLLIILAKAAFLFCFIFRRFFIREASRHELTA